MLAFLRFIKLQQWSKLCSGQWYHQINPQHLFLHFSNGPPADPHKVKPQGQMASQQYLLDSIWLDLNLFYLFHLFSLAATCWFWSWFRRTVNCLLAVGARNSSIHRNFLSFYSLMSTGAIATRELKNIKHVWGGKVNIYRQSSVKLGFNFTAHFIFMLKWNHTPFSLL